MPFYEYECSSCKYYTEVMQKISDAPLRKCPSCGRNTLKKLMSAPNFRLKGGGWYETDFKSDQETKRNLAGADKEDAAKPEAAAGAKDATPAADAKSADAKAGEGKAKPAPVEKTATASKRPAGRAASTAKAPAPRAAKSKLKSKPKPKAKSGARRARR